MRASSTSGSAWLPVMARGAPCTPTMTADAGSPTANRSTVTSRGAVRTPTIRPSTVPSPHSTAAPIASPAAPSSLSRTANGSGNATSQAPTSAGTAISQ
ncbi:hypothetical protein GCM10023175_41890 [Pseudonocardia xishanensis]|uniref:Uncharacterized protein n=1 Tax=Pseudonocardia xishanensis TaxID=630995 RepID=A0ABP8RWQ2_9PSEU